jgi:hypothetical protein
MARPVMRRATWASSVSKREMVKGGGGDDVQICAFAGKTMALRSRSW